MIHPIILKNTVKLLFVLVRYYTLNPIMPILGTVKVRL